MTVAELNALLSARSEGEHAEDHLPGALNWPSLNNEERIQVGTLYKQVSPFEAQKIGASLVAANISRHIQTHVLDKARNWQPLIYCWRGGKRSNSLALILGQIGFKVHLIEGGYKAFRKAVIPGLPALFGTLIFVALLAGFSRDDITDQFLWLTLVTIWALTVPHMIVTAKLDRAALKN